MQLDLSAVKQTVAELHDNTTMLAMRYGHTDTNGVPHNSAGGCFYGISGLLGNKDLPYVYAAYHGDGAEMSFDAIKDNAIFNQSMMAHQTPWNKFTGTPRSKRWVEYLLSETSPWRALHGNIAVTDPDYINQAGFIFHDLPSLPRKLSYNFVMAIRYPWEMTRYYELFLRLVDSGVEPNTACYISVNYVLRKEATDLSGPYDVIYPWSFLEETNLEAAGRFILGKPGTVSTSESVTSPNVAPLWKCATSGPVYEHSQTVFRKFCDDNNLSLSAILDGISECVEKQKTVI